MSDALDPKQVRPRTFDTSKIDALSSWLSQALDAAVRVTDATLLSGGAVQENWRIEVNVASGTGAGTWSGTGDHTWVLRTDAAQRLVFSLDREAEYAVLKAAHAAGITVAQPIVRCADETVIGRPFLIQAFVPGQAQARAIVRNPDLAAFGDTLAATLGRELAKIHALTPSAPDLSVLPIPLLPPAKVQVAGLKAALAGASQARPALEYVLAWLDAHAPTTPQITLVHGDFRTGNYLLQETQLSAILDWEFAHWGDPLEDIGWFCARCWRFGRDEAWQEAGGIGTRRAFYEAYTAAGGRAITDAGVAYWEVMAAAKWAVIALLQGDRFLVGGETAIELALTGLMAPEMEFDALDGISAIEAGKAQ
jgi:aminoglycoside phosphotransferase (APT) family kinase protein